MYLDGCNLPIGMRGVDFRELMDSSATKDGAGGDDAPATTISPETFRITSRKRDHNNPSNVSTVDWVPIFQSALSPESAPRLGCISVMFDGAKFSNWRGKKSSTGGGSFRTRVFPLDAPMKSGALGHGSMQIEITEDGDSADDVLFDRCRPSANGSSDPSPSAEPARETIPLDRVVEMLSSSDDGDDLADHLSSYVVIRRKAGGSKTHRRLFDKLNLRRPNEGALCLSALTAGLQKSSLRIARELQRERSIEKVIKCELRRRDELRYVVVTDDVYLTDRLTRNNVMVLRFSQLRTMW